MVNRWISIVAILLVFAISTERAGFAISTPDVLSARQQIVARGVGKGVKVHLADGRLLRGKIVSVEENEFHIQAGSAPAIELPFADVRQVEGPGLSKGAKIGIWVGVGVLVIIVAAAASYAHAVTGFAGNI